MDITQAAAIRAAQVECDVCGQEMGAISGRTKAYRELGKKLDVIVCRQLALEAALRLFDAYLASCDVIQESTVASFASAVTPRQLRPMPTKRRPWPLFLVPARRRMSWVHAMQTAMPWDIARLWKLFAVFRKSS